MTVVIPTHNRRALLSDAIDSALTQRDVNVEVVVVDDASSDGTSEWLRTHADPRVRHIRFAEHRERTAARNAGLAQCTTPYVLFLDDDDQLAPSALRRLAQALGRHPAAPVAAGTYATFGTLAPDDEPRQPTIGRLPVRRRMWREILWGWYLLPGAGLWRADFLRDIGGWDESRSFAEDLELSLRIHPHPMALVPHAVLRYRLHGRSVDAETKAGWEVMNEEVRQRFLSGLKPSERRKGQQVVDARPTFVRALAAYAEGDYRAALSGIARGLRTAPSLIGSPILGPMLASMMLKSTVALAAPAGVRRRVRDARRATRAARHGQHAA